MANENSNANSKAKTKAKNDLVPPDERFWKRYSPNHEFPLSSTSSIVLHALVLGTLLLIAFIIKPHFFPDKPPDVDAVIVIAGGGGRPDGVEGPATGTEEKKAEAIKQTDKTPDSLSKVEPPKENLKAVETRPDSVLPPEKSSGRPVEAAVGMGKDLNTIGDAARKRLEQAMRGSASKGRGGSGEGGGKGKGRGTGEGDLSGPGVQKITQRKKRQQRWVMIFNTRDGEDYLRQLAGLKAILAVPSDSGEQGDYQFIEDFTRRPVELRRKDVSQIDRIYWIDDKPESVSSLALSLRLNPAPAYFVAFFPEELEKDLLDKELAFKHTPEDEIEETRFQVHRKRYGGGYEPVVVDQIRKRK